MFGTRSLSEADKARQNLVRRQFAFSQTNSPTNRALFRGGQQLGAIKLAEAEGMPPDIADRLQLEVAKKQVEQSRALGNPVGRRMDFVVDPNTNPPLQQGDARTQQQQGLRTPFGVVMGTNPRIPPRRPLNILAGGYIASQTPDLPPPRRPWQLPK